MKLLFDNNLLHKLVDRLSDLFPQSTHVMTERMDETSDHKIWLFAKENDYSIITKDIDYNALSVLYGHPPKVILLRIGNCKVQTLERIIRVNFEHIQKFSKNEKLSLTEIG